MISKETTDQNTFWMPTCVLRWKMEDAPLDIINQPKVLQQLWKGHNSGEEEWRDIETK